MRVTYRKPQLQHIEMTFTLTRHASPRTVFHDDGPGCLLVRTGKNKAVGVEYDAIMLVLGDVLPHSPDMRRDLRAMLDASPGIEPTDDPDSETSDGGAA